MRSATVSRPRSGRTLGLLSAYVALLYLLPPRLVLRGPLGSAGRPAMVLGMGLAVLWWLGRLRPDDGGHRPTPTRWLIGGYLAAWCLSVAFAYERGLSPIESSGAERYLLLIGSLVGTALVVCDSIGDRATLDALLRRLTWAGALSGVIGLVQFRFKVNVAGWISAPGLRLDAPSGGLDTRGSSGFARALGTAGHPIEFAVLSALLLPLALHYALLSADRAQAQRRWTIVALVSLGVPLSVSRSGIVALALVAAVVLRLWRPAAQRVGWVVFGVSVVVLRLAVPGLVGTLVSFFQNASTDNSVTGRTQDYAAVADLVGRRPLFGLGGGTFRPEEYFILDNYWLNALLSTGLVGTVALAAMLCGSYAMAIRIARSTDDVSTASLATSLAASIAGAIGVSFTFDSFNFSSFAGTMFVLVGAIGALWRLRDQPGRAPAAGEARLTWTVKARTQRQARLTLLAQQGARSAEPAGRDPISEPHRSARGATRP